MFKVKHIKRYKDLLFRVARSEGAIRGSAYWFFVPMIMIISGANNYFLGDRAKKKKLEEQ